MTTKLIISIFCCLSLAGQKVFAATQGAQGIDGGNTIGTSKPQPTVNAGANQSQSDNSFGQALNYAVGGAEIVGGGAMIRAGTLPCFNIVPACNWPLIGMGTMLVMMGTTNIAQGDEHGSAANSAGITSGLSNGFGTGINGVDSTNPLVKAALNDPNFKAVGPILKDLQAKGILDPATGTVKIGDKTYSASDFSSPAAMAAAGFPKGMIDGALAANADAEKNALDKLNKIKIGASTSENGYAEGGAGGSSGVTSSEEGQNAFGAGVAKTKSEIGLPREPTSLAGMTKNFNGAVIGVAGDSLFDMMSRRYKLKDSQDSFFGPKDLSLQK